MDHAEEDSILNILVAFVSDGLIPILEDSSRSLKEKRASEGMLLNLLPVIVPTLRCQRLNLAHFKFSKPGDILIFCFLPSLRMATEEQFSSSRIADLSLQYIDEARELPALAAITAGNETPGSLSFGAFKAALAFFPVEPLLSVGKCSAFCQTKQESDMLMDFYRHQVSLELIHMRFLWVN